jgi:hypothetical protein
MEEYEPETRKVGSKPCGKVQAPNKQLTMGK